MFVGWEAAGHRTVSHAETVGMGGLFLHTPSPPAEGSFIRLVFDLKTGEVRARAIVRYSSPGKGMGGAICTDGDDRPPAAESVLVALRRGASGRSP